MGRRRKEYYVNPISGRKIPVGYTENPITGELVKEQTLRIAPILPYASPNTVSRARTKPLTNQEKWFRDIAILTFFLVIALFFLYQWALAHVLETVLILVGTIIVIGLVVWKFPQAVYELLGSTLGSLGGILKPPEETEKDRRIMEGKYEKVPPLSPGEIDALRYKVGDRCELCHKQVPLEVHHIVPRSEGGSNKQDNLIACSTCHDRAQRGEPPRHYLLYHAKMRKHEDKPKEYE